MELENLLEHLQTLTPQDWDRLFDCLPEIEATNKFGELKGGDITENGSMTFPYWNAAVVVDRVTHILYDLKLIVPFDWSRWEEGKAMLKDQTFNYNSLDTVTLCMLLTTIVRADRFSDGFLVSNFENGVILKIITALQKNEKIEF